MYMYGTTRTRCIHIHSSTRQHPVVVWYIDYIVKPYHPKLPVQTDRVVYSTAAGSSREKYDTLPRLMTGICGGDALFFQGKKNSCPPDIIVVLCYCCVYDVVSYIADSEQRNVSKCRRLAWGNTRPCRLHEAIINSKCNYLGAPSPITAKKGEATSTSTSTSVPYISGSKPRQRRETTTTSPRSGDFYGS